MNAQCLKITQNVAFFKFWHFPPNSPYLAFSINFCPLKMYTKLASLAMLNETFYVIFNHCVNEEIVNDTNAVAKFGGDFCAKGCHPCY